jgi:yeast amino acid transporter
MPRKSNATNSRQVFGYFTNLVTIFGILTWISILVTHIFFVRARQAQGIQKTSMAYTSPVGMWGSVGALVFCVIIALTKNFTVFVPDEDYGKFDYENFITGYLGIPVYLILIFGYKLVVKSPRVKPSEADFYTGKDIIDRQEEEFLAQQAEKKKNVRGGWFYRTFVAWLF